MRKELFRMPDANARRMLARARAVQVAGTTAAGVPVLRTVNAVVLGDVLAFHGAPVGEKTECVGREVVVACDETVASIPSYFVDPERACPATTLYESVQAHGVLAQVDDPARKAQVLGAIMAKYQPEGGHVPLDAEHPLYARALASLLVVEVPLNRVDGKAKLGQNRTPAELARILDGLWARGAPGDARAIERIRLANPRQPAPAFLAAPPAAPGTSLHASLDDADADAAAALLEGAYWLEGIPRAETAATHRASTAHVGARDGSGALVASARATADGRVAWIYDVVVDPAHRARGLGQRLVELLLAHPDVRRAPLVRLSTRDAQSLYARLGFHDLRERPLRRWPVTDMALARPPTP